MKEHTLHYLMTNYHYVKTVLVYFNVFLTGVNLSFGYSNDLFVS